MNRIFLILFVLLCGCTDAEYARNTAYGTKFKVTFYSGGTEVRSWTSTGKVLSEPKSDGWYFVDAETKKFIRVSGDVTIEQL